MYQINFEFDMGSITYILIYFLMTLYVVGFIFGTVMYFEISEINLIECILSGIHKMVGYIIFVHLAIFIMLRFILTNNPLVVLDTTISIITSIVSLR